MAIPTTGYSGNARHYVATRPAIGVRERKIEATEQKDSLSSKTRESVSRLLCRW